MEEVTVKAPAMHPPHVVRMELELIQLESRIRDLLKAYPLQALASEDHLTLERAQYEGMTKYRDALATRIEREMEGEDEQR